MGNMNTIKFIVDECVGSVVTKWLVENGYDAISVITDMKGAKDIAILNRAAIENRIIITSDKDFGDIVFHKKAHHTGIILIKLHKETSKNKIKILENLLGNYADQLINNFIVISETNIRIVKPLMS